MVFFDDCHLGCFSFFLEGRFTAPSERLGREVVTTGGAHGRDLTFRGGQAGNSHSAEHTCKDEGL